MFRNLEAEQARKGLTDQEVANKLGISRVSYGNKKKSGKFGSRNFVVDATFLYLVASTLNGIQNAFKWNTVISDFW